jgi:maltose O-acetyltransferase
MERTMAFRMPRLIRRIYRRLIPPPQYRALARAVELGLTVGRKPRILDGVIIDPDHCWHITIGDDVTLAPRVHILAHDASTGAYLKYTRIGKVTIGSRVFVGASAIILPGVTIGNDVVVAAGSVVTRDVPDGTVVAGNPARVIGTIDDFVSKKKKEMERVPCFGEEYTLRRDVSAEMKDEMNRRMKDRIGYVI